MPADFPSGPTLNQTYTFGDRTWKWNGTGWALQSNLLSTAQLADGAVTTAKLADGAVTTAKLASLTAGNILLGNASNVATSTTITGDISISSSGVTTISSGVIVNADISASASIDHGKLASITGGSILMGNASNVPTATVVTGDITITSSGVTAIASGAVTPAKLDRAYARAAFAYFCSSF